VPPCSCWSVHCCGHLRGLRTLRVVLRPRVGPFRPARDATVARVCKVLQQLTSRSKWMRNASSFFASAALGSAGSISQRTWPPPCVRSPSRRSRCGWYPPAGQAEGQVRLPCKALIVCGRLSSVRVSRSPSGWSPTRPSCRYGHRQYYLPRLNLQRGDRLIAGRCLAAGCWAAIPTGMQASASNCAATRQRDRFRIGSRETHFHCVRRASRQTVDRLFLH